MYRERFFSGKKDYIIHLDSHTPPYPIIDNFFRAGVQKKKVEDEKGGEQKPSPGMPMVGILSLICMDSADHMRELSIIPYILLATSTNSFIHLAPVIFFFLSPFFHSVP